MPVSITRRNPRTGTIERPWRNRDGMFVLGDPAHGAQKHHDKFAVKVATLEEVAELVQQRGFSLRMSDGSGAPALISPNALTIEEVDGTETTPLFLETGPKPPFTKEAMLAELRRALLVQANQIAHAGSLEAAHAFIGFETENPLYPYCEDDPQLVDLRRFSAAHHLGLAYDFAFQDGQYWLFGDDTAQDVNELVHGANAQATNGERSPLADPDSLCRRAADAAYARWRLGEGYDPSVRELALVTSMTEAAVRNSLSRERIAVEAGKVEHNTARVWLEQRRDFIATRTDEAHRERWAAQAKVLLDARGFDHAFVKLMRDYPMRGEELAKKAGVPRAFVEALIGGKVKPDLDALRRVGEALDLDVPHFVGAAVEAALRAVQPAK